MSSSEEAGAGAPAWLLRCGDFFFRWRNYVFPAVLAALFLTLRPQPWLGDAALDEWLDVIGVLVACAGQALRALVIGLAYIKRGGLNKQVYADRLVTEGMFQVCRNPLYVGNALILLGLLLIFHHPLAYLVGIGFFGFVYWSIVASEERFLRSKFGQGYADYCAGVNRFLPSPGRLAEAARGMSFNWRRVLLKDYGSAYGWVLAAVVLEAYEEELRNGAGVLIANLEPYLALFVAATALAVLVRWLKKSKRLTEAA